jgi:NAD(P)-dependent dehydrogenase (short-subunit alcohol dehydrogenase family)
MEYDRTYFKGKTAVVTGGASGIGLALAEELLESGADRVVIADINQDNLKEHAERLNKQYNGRIKGILCNVTSETEVQNLIAESVKFFDGRIDIMFNNAGAGLGGLFDDLTNEDWKAGFDVNLYSAIYGMRAVLPIMKKQGGGQIINTISGIAFMPMAQQTLYAATKAALHAVSIAMRCEYWDDNIKISSATPGTTATNIFKSGGTETPAFAQTPHQSASRILSGVVNNDRIIFGDDGDISGGKSGNNIDAFKEIDAYLLRVARERREGKMAF